MMIKRIFLNILCVGSIMVSTATKAQRGIGTVTPASSSVLDLTSPNKAFLLPRVANPTVIAVPVSGMMIYDLSTNCVKVYRNGAWYAIAEMAVGFPSTTPTLCVNTPLTTIVHNTVNATGIDTPTGLPSGVTASWASNKIIISGTPHAVGSFSYSIPLVGGGSPVNARGTITVIGMMVSAASNTPNLLINTPLATVTHSTVNATGIGSSTGLPAGVNASWSGNTITISGTPTQSGTFSYSIPLLGVGGGCSAMYATGTIMVNLCGANVASGVFKAFMCHNLGADVALDPHTPVQGIHGNYYQWGRIAVVANASTSVSAITGWNTSNPANDAWLGNSKTANDPCPAGFRVPTKVQWQGVVDNNTITRIGFWNASATNFGTAIKFGTGLSLPAAGGRQSSDGALTQRGSRGYYWSSDAHTFMIFDGTANGMSVGANTYGYPVRCVAE